MKKRKYFFILILLIINAFLIINIFYTKKINANNENCYNKNKIFANQDITISEGVRCNNINNSSYGIGRMLFSFYGTDADCYSNDKTEIQKQKCLNNHIWGGKGTMRIGNNWVVRDANRIFFNGHDRSGNHWWMTTTTEPLGNVLGLVKDYSKKTANIRFGNDLVIGNDLVFNEKNEDSLMEHSNILHFPRGDKLMIVGKNITIIKNEGIKIQSINNKKDQVKFNISGDYNGSITGKTNEHFMANDINFEITKKRLSNSYISQYDFNNGVNIDGTAKIHATTTFRKYAQFRELPGSKRPSEIEYKKQYEWDYHLYDPEAKTSMQTREKFVGYNPVEYNEFPPYTGTFYPQPYVHFRVVGYKARSEKPGISSMVRGDICTSVCKGHRNLTNSLILRNNIRDEKRNCNNNNVACIESCVTRETNGQT